MINAKELVVSDVVNPIYNKLWVEIMPTLLKSTITGMSEAIRNPRYVALDQMQVNIQNSLISDFDE